jgi:hypothetical protein
MFSSFPYVFKCFAEWSSMLSNRSLPLHYISIRRIYHLTKYCCICATKIIFQNDIHVWGYVYSIFILYSCAPVSADSLSAVSVIRGLPRPEKIGKLKKWLVHKFQNSPSKNGLQHGEIQQLTHTQYFTRLPLTLYLCFPTELASILLPSLSLFTLVATLSQCLCSDSPYLP